MGSAFDEVNWSTLLYDLSLNPFKTCPVKTMSFQTLGLLLVLSAVAYSDSSTMSQVEVPLERRHAKIIGNGPVQCNV